VRFSPLPLGLFAALLLLAPLAEAQSADRTVYWIGPETGSGAGPLDAIYAYDLDAGRADTLVRASTLGPNEQRVFFGLAVDVGRGRLYWTDSGGTYPNEDGPGEVDIIGPILRSHLDGTGVEVYIRGAVCGLGSPIDLEIDSASQTLYWSTSSDCPVSNVYYADASGPPPDEWRRFPTSRPFTVRAVEVDAPGNALYWVDGELFAGDPGVYAAPLDETAEERQIIAGDVCDVALDPASASLFWTRCGDGVVRRSDLDGSNTEVVLDVGAEVTYLALDRDDRKVYWSEAGEGPGTGAIRRANLDGTGVADVVTGLTEPRALELGFGGLPTDAEPEGPASTGATLGPVWPNPVRGATSVTFELAEPSPVALAVFDATGREVRRVLDGARAAGSHTLALPVGGLPSGLYVVRLVAGADVASRRVVVVR
jgi:hypothetical protein